MIVMKIDTNDESLKKELSYKREELLYAQRQKGFYETQDFKLIRTTNHLEQDRFIRPLFHLPFITKNNRVIRNAITDILDEEKHIDFYLEEDKYLARSNMINETYLPYSSQYRSTVHFTINGLVTSHSKGDFSNRDFIIIEPLSFHLKNSDVRSFRMEDTFIYGDVKLSDDTVIMIREDKYETLLLENPALKKFKIVLYTGDEHEAVNMYLTSIGIISEQIEAHNAQEHSCSNQIRQFGKKLHEAYGISSEPHWLSKEYRSDDEYSLIIWEYYNNLFYSFFLKKQSIEEPLYSVLLTNLMDEQKSDQNQEYFKQVISEMGLDQFKRIIDEFNLNILKSIELGTFKNNEQIVQELKSNQKG